MADTEIRAKSVRELIALQLEVAQHRVEMDKKLREDLGLTDSLALVELILALEDRFQIEIPDEEVDKLPDPTVADICSLVERRLLAHGRIADHGADPLKWLENMVPKSAEIKWPTRPVEFVKETPQAREYKEIPIDPAQVRAAEVRIVVGGDDPDKKAD